MFFFCVWVGECMNREKKDDRWQKKNFEGKKLFLISVSYIYRVWYECQLNQSIFLCVFGFGLIRAKTFSFNLRNEKKMKLLWFGLVWFQHHQ